MCLADGSGRKQLLIPDYFLIAFVVDIGVGDGCHIIIEVVVFPYHFFDGLTLDADNVHIGLIFQLLIGLYLGLREQFCIEQIVHLDGLVALGVSCFNFV